MNEKAISDAIDYIIKKVIIELTDTSRAILAIGYPMETEDQMISSIKNRAKIQVLEYSIQQNEPHEVAEIPNINMITNS